MEKSKAYYLAQIAVVASPTITPESKLKILRVLMDAEELELYREEQEMERAAAEVMKEIEAETAAVEE